MWGFESRLTSFRVAVVGLLLLGAVTFTGSYLAASVPTETEPIEDGRGAVLVATIDATGPSQIVAYGPDGDILYENHTLDIYHDVDPNPTRARTVMYVASELTVADRNCPVANCIENVVERLNLTTGNVTRLYTVIEQGFGSSQVHDVDRVNESVLLVADISFPDRVYMVNTTSDEIIWQWRVQEDYTPKSGGMYPGDWTHLNDVEYLPDGRVMVSLRNMDQVVFIDPGRGLQENWTLGIDDDHSILYEQHNPDYIPPARGGPAVLIADSENNRIVEYQRVDGHWERTWVWRDARLQWPRDADRLPNGNTLVVDSHGSRIFAVNPAGRIVWQMGFPDGGYDVEQLGTGDESAHGESARSLGYRDRHVTLTGDPLSTVVYHVTTIPPSLVLHGLLFALPDRVTPLGAVAVLFDAVVLVGWLAVEGVTAWRR